MEKINEKNVAEAEVTTEPKKLVDVAEPGQMTSAKIETAEEKASSIDKIKKWLNSKIYSEDQIKLMQDKEKFASNFTYTDEKAKKYISQQAQRLTRLKFDKEVGEITQADIDQVTSDAAQDKYEGNISTRNGKLLYVNSKNINWSDPNGGKGGEV